MSEINQRIFFSNNLNNLLHERKKTQKEVAEAIGVSPQTFNTWCQGIALPRMGKLQKLADYFHIMKSELLDPTPAAPGIVRTLSDDELEVVKAYREADNIGKEAVRRVLGIEEKRDIAENSAC